MAKRIPFAFDADFYRAHNPDLAHMVGQEALEHFHAYGVDEGRQGAALGSRPAFIEHLATIDSVLEIGPFCRPTVRGRNVRYLDMLDSDQLRARAREIGLDASGCPERIHYVGDIAAIDETFDAVVSSHSIEHQPDLIHHLEGVARILRPEMGLYFLFVPDKRYCFDHFIPESTIADVIQAHSEKRTLHTLQSVIEHHALNTHNDPGSHWAGDHGEQHASNQTDRIHSAIALHRDNPGYIDVHAWYFTPTNFWNIVKGLNACGLTALEPVAIFPTLRETSEFFAVLKRT